MRVLLTGRGSIAQRHARHLREAHPDVQLAVLSTSPQIDASLQPCTHFDTLQQALAWNPQAVIIASVSSRHGEELQAALSRGLPCLAEKPLVISTAELAQARSADAAANAAGAGRGPVVVGCNLRYLPSLRRVADELRSGSLGRVVRAQLECGQDLAQWRPGRDLAQTYSARPELGGGVVFDLVHEIDMALWLLGPLRVRAAIGGHFGPRPDTADDVHVALLQTAAGAPVTVSLDTVSQQLVRRYAFTCEAGTLYWDLRAKKAWIDHTGGTRVLTEDPVDFDIAATYRAQMQDWLAAIADPQHAVASPLDQAMDATELMLQMKESST